MNNLIVSVKIIFYIRITTTLKEIIIMTTKKKLIELSIENLEEKLKISGDILKSKIKEINDNIKDFITNFFEIPSENLQQVSLSDFSTVIEIITESNNYTSELSIYHPTSYNNEYGIGYFSTNVKESSTQTLIYLELVGKIAQDFRDDKILIHQLNEARKKLTDANKSYNDLSNKLSKLKYDLNRLIEDELFDKAMANKGVKLLEPLKTTIRPNDKYNTKISEIQIVGHTEKTITIKYLSDEGNELDLYRQSYNDGRQEVIMYQSVLEENKKEI
jgi:hypothetical protein